ncbi:leucyl aminopeptidase [Kocuria sp. JC486]|uniref:leucyl aminopeptidase n=1 Tax=Kocuria sp. JC486 TaxID=1970736 RepID=UPI001421E97E|nr:leucyl aminopeptidase [Kocuria sp. JC486]NHU84380.1 leucyl aminopeptidase [Kocuria sp. JC486]
MPRPTARNLAPNLRRRGSRTPDAAAGTGQGLIDLLPSVEVELATTDKKLAKVTADAVVLAVQKTPAGPVVLLPADAKGLPLDLEEQAKAVGATGAADEVKKLAAPKGSPWPSIVLTGLGTGDESPSHVEALRRSAGSATRALGKTDHAVFAFPVESVEEAAAVAEGIALGAYGFRAQKAKTAHSVGAPLTRATVLTSGIEAQEQELTAAVNRAEVLGRAVSRARTLVTLSPDVVFPESVAELAQALADGSTTSGKSSGELTVEVLDESELRAGGFGGLIGVGQGAARPPRLVRIGWEPKSPVESVALVGKGITFDSGGLSLKPANSMMTMKSDMAGAAAVLATVFAAAEAQLPVSVTGWLCLAENLPSGTATRPGDVITIRGGRTVEVLNTDAEGRLVLADGLVAAREEDPGLLLDIATLTGAQMVALGTRTAGVMGDDDAVETVLAASVASGEDLWPMPLPQHLRASLDSDVADLKNIGDRNGGMLVAGLFLKEFAGAQEAAGESAVEPVGPWAHLDIAGPSFNEDGPWGYTPKQGTGFGVRTMFSVIEMVGGEPV